MLECGELQLITREKCEKIQFKSEFTQSSVTYSNLNSRSSVEEVYFPLILSLEGSKSKNSTYKSPFIVENID